MKQSLAKKSHSFTEFAPFQFLGLAVVLSLSACGSDSTPKTGPIFIDDGGEEDAGTPCVDKDKDGFGKNCKKGKDCDDKNSKVTDECYRCASPEKGCPCEPGTQPILCELTPTESDGGQTICHEGTRYCRNGKWTGCESVRSYAVSPSESARIIDPDAGAVPCDVCAINCYKIVDILDPRDGGLTGDNSDPKSVFWADGGGLTLLPSGDGGVSEDAGPPVCHLGVGPDTDCDGIPDEFDPYPQEKPFRTDNEAVFLQIAPGQTRSDTIEVEFYLKTADIYFLLDQTGSMAEERVNLHSALTSGTFLESDVNCADTDYDGNPNNELKSRGIVGSIQCLIRDAWFGAGFVREMPFSPHGDSQEVLFRNYQDISAEVNETRDAINRMTNNSNNDWPEGQTQALWSVATGGGMYMGYNRAGIPPRQDCPAETWGYPCFRNGAVPIIILFTDAMFHNGPAPNGYAYNSSYSITKGTTADYTPVVGNDYFDNVYDLGDVTSSFKTYTGDTYPMKADLRGSVVGCSANDSANDAVFKFNITSTKTVTIDTAGSDYDTVISLHSDVPTLEPNPISVSDNETRASAYETGDIYKSWFVGTGSTAAMNPDYQGGVVGCSAASGGKDAVFSFSLSQPTTVAIGTSGSGFDTVLSLYNGAMPARPTPVAVVDANDTQATADDAGGINSAYKVYTGSTNASGIKATYPETVVGCSGDAGSPDAVFAFSLLQATRVRLDTEDSSFDTVISLHNGTIGVPTITTANNKNEAIGSALNVGDAYNAWFQVEGNTSTMTADYTNAFVGCNAGSTSPDAVVTFTVSQQSAFQIDTIGSSFDTVLGLYSVGSYDRNELISETSLANENHASAFALGELYKGYLEVSGPSIAPAASDYLSSVIGCSAGEGSPDIAFGFSLLQETNVKIDASGSSFDNVISLHNGAIPLGSVQAVSGNEKESDAYNVGVLDGNILAYSGNTTSMAADYTGPKIGCSANDSAPDAAFKFRLNAAKQIQIDTEGSSYDTVIGLFSGSIGGNPPSRPSAVNIYSFTADQKSNAYDAGSIDTQWKVLTGDTTNMAADAGSFGCSVNANAKDAYIKFTLSSQRTVAIDNIGSSFDTVLGLYKWDDTYQTCDDNSGGGNASRVIQTLAAGDYYVIVKGKGSNDKGAFELSLRGFPTATDIGTSGEQKSSIYDAGTLDGQWKVFTGNTSTMAANAGSFGCSVSASAKDAYVKFTLSSQRTVVIDTVNSTFDTVIGLYKWNDTYVTCDDNSGGNAASKLTQTLAAGSYYIIVKGKASGDSGAYQISLLDSAGYGSTTSDIAVPGEYKAKSYDAGTIDGQWKVFGGDTTNMVANASAFGCSASAGANDAYIKFTLSSQHSVTIDTVNSSFNTVAGLFNWSTDALVACDNDSGGGNNALFNSNVERRDLLRRRQGGDLQRQGSF